MWCSRCCTSHIYKKLSIFRPQQAASQKIWKLFNRNSWVVAVYLILFHCLFSPKVISCFFLITCKLHLVTVSFLFVFLLQELHVAFVLFFFFSQDKAKQYFTAQTLQTNKISSKTIKKIRPVVFRSNLFAGDNLKRVFILFSNWFQTNLFYCCDIKHKKTNWVSDLQPLNTAYSGGEVPEMAREWRSLLLYSEGTRYFGAGQGAASKQVQATGPCPHANLCCSLQLLKKHDGPVSNHPSNILFCSSAQGQLKY